MRTWLRIGGAALLVLVLPVVASAGVIDQAIPADAKVVVIASDLKKVDSGVKAFVEAIGVPLPPMISVDALTQASGLGEHWDTAQGGAFVMTELSDKGAVLVIPVKNGPKAAAALGGQAEGSFHRVNVAGNTMTALVLPKLLVLSEGSAPLEAFRAPVQNIASRWSADAKRLAGSSAVFFYVDVPSLRPLVEMGLAQFDTIKGQFRAMPPGALGPGMDADTMIAVFDMYAKGIRSLVEQMTAIYGGANLDGQKARIHVAASFAKDGYLGKVLAAQKTPSANLLAGLPAMPFYMAAGADLSGLQSAWTDLMQAMLDQLLLTSKMTAAEKKELLEVGGAFYRQMKAVNMIIDIGAGGMTSVGRYSVDDPAKAMTQIEATMKASDAMMKMFMSGMSFKSKQRTVAGVDVIEMDAEIAPAQNPQQEMQVRMLKAMYGERVRMQFGVVGKTLGFAMANRDDAIVLLKETGTPLADDPRIQKILADLPSRPSAIVLFDPFGFLRMMSALLSQVALPIPLPAIPGDNLPPPIGVAITANADGVTKEIVVRTDTVRELVKFGMSFRR